MYIAETELKESLNVNNALTKIYGLNIKKSSQICKKLGFSKNLKISEINEIQKDTLSRYLDNTSILLNSELKKKKEFLTQKTVEIKLYRGLRKLKGYPVRGQRTRSNAKTSRRCKFYNFYATIKIKF